MFITNPHLLRFLVSTALLTLLCGGCVSQGPLQRPIAHAACYWQVVDSSCYGYYPTCWRTWSDECQMCVAPDAIAPQIHASQVINPAPLDVPLPVGQSEPIQTPDPVLPGNNMPDQEWPTPPEIQSDPSRKESPSPPAPPILQTPSAASWPEHRPPVVAQVNAW